jgi:uncharacterized protein (TIGR02453 family)
MKMFPGSVAQLVERTTENREVTGSTPVGATMSSAYFPSEAAVFLRQLTANNSREFFTAHRDVYESAVREPLEALAASAQEIYGPAKVFRPNRDVRFSPNKAPYRSDASMWAGEVGGVYIRLTAEDIKAGGGLYELSRDQLANARRAITEVPGAAAQLSTIRQELRKSGYTDAGTSLVTAPRGFDKNHEHIELLRLKHFAAMVTLPVTASKKEIETAWAGIEGLISWVTEHVGPA